jgi:uncharacterized protein YukE
MAGNLDIIKEYLVSIGFAVNQAQFNKANKQMTDLEKMVKGQSKSMASNVTAAGKYLSVAVTSVISSVSKMATGQDKAFSGKQFTNWGKQITEAKKRLADLGNQIKKTDKELTDQEKKKERKARETQLDQGRTGAARLTSGQPRVPDNADKVPNNSDNEAIKSLNKEVNRGKILAVQFKEAIKQLGIAMKYITPIIASTTSAIAGMVAWTAKAQLEYQKFGTRMWMDTQTAKDFKIALDGVGESMEDIAWNPELRNQFMELNRLSKSLHTPGDSVDRFRGVRDIMFEFKKFRVEMKYATEWISYYLIKNFAGPLKKIHEYIQDIQKKLVIHMPEWTKKVADFFTSFLNVAGSAIRFIKDIFNTVFDFFQKSPGKVKMMLLAIGAAITLFLAGPAGRMAAAFGFLLLLIEDFYAYLDGRKSSKTLAPIWKEFLKIYESFKDAKFGDSLRTLIQGLADVVKGIHSVFSTSTGKDANNTLQFWQAFAKAISTVVEKLGQLLSFFGKGFSGAPGLETTDAFEKLFGIKNDKTKPKTGFRKFLEFLFTSPQEAQSKYIEARKKDIKKASLMYGVPEELIRRVIRQESGGDQSKVSSKGAIGLMQLMPKTAKALGVNPKDASQNIMGGTKYLSQLYKQFGSWEKALAAYNAGPGTVKKYGGIPPYAETRNYVESILRGINLKHLQNNLAYLQNGGYQQNVYQNPRKNVGDNITTITVGDVVVTVGGSNASPQEIAKAVKVELQTLNKIDTTRKMRDLSGVQL